MQEPPVLRQFLGEHCPVRLRGKTETDADSASGNVRSLGSPDEVILGRKSPQCERQSKVHRGFLIKFRSRRRAARVYSCSKDTTIARSFPELEIISYC